MMYNKKREIAGMGTPALPTSIKKLTEGRVTALVTRLFSFCYLRNERISTTKVANITAKDNASNTVIVPPPHLVEWKSQPSYLTKGIIP